MTPVFNFSSFIVKINEAANKYDTACAMLFFSYPQMTEVHEAIAPEDVYTEDGFGLETKPHCSLLAGLHKEVRPQQVIQTIQEFPIPLMRLTNASLFPPRPASPFEVLKFDVRGAGLHDINKALCDKYPYTSMFNYHPHCTIAYLKKGTGAKYAEQFKDMKIRARAEEIVYSKAGGNMIRVYL